MHGFSQLRGLEQWNVRVLFLAEKQSCLQSREMNVLMQNFQTLRLKLS